MNSSYGDNIRITIFGQSHAPAIGVTIQDLPAGLTIDRAALQAFLDRRAPGRDATSTARREADAPEFLSGLVGDVTCGAPLTAIIRNSNTRSQDYEELRAVPRPGHADWPAQVRFGGFQDVAGGGHFSGRLTAPLCIAGGIVLQILAQEGVSVQARAERVGGETDPDRQREAILAAKAAGDSVGGVIAAEVCGRPVGVGDPMFGGLENRIAQAVFGIPAVKGIEFGDGFAASERRGSENNDPYRMVDGKVKPVTNHAGGILGGLSTGEPITFRVAIKPTSSIAIEQDSVNLQTGENARLRVHGRHDPCIVLRAVPCVEAAAALAVFDALLERRKEGK
ncbi:MAG: chorismate synthase [Kiritimatiellae bacterium]|nr:chorismate synthase [Kiritimatiellia bacterium]